MAPAAPGDRAIGSATPIGDCMSYATAQLARQPLLAIGNDFARTDLEFGDGIVGHWPAPPPQ